MRPAKAHSRAGTAVGRSKDAFAEHESESIEKQTVFVGFLVAQIGGGLGLTDRVIAVRWSFLHPAAAALPAVVGGSGQWGRSQLSYEFCVPLHQPPASKA